MEYKKWWWLRIKKVDKEEAEKIERARGGWQEKKQNSVPADYLSVSAIYAKRSRRISFIVFPLPT